MKPAYANRSVSDKKGKETVVNQDLDYENGQGLFWIG